MKKEKQNVVAFIIVSLFSLMIWFLNRNKNHGLIENGVIFKAQIVKCDYLPKAAGATDVIYQTIINGKEIEGSSSYVSFDQKFCEDNLLEKHFFVIIDTCSEDNSHLLLTPDDFKTFGLEFPDSLKWVKVLKP